MRSRIFGWIGIVWGAAIVATRPFGSEAEPVTSSAYVAGRSGAVLFGLLMLVVGVYFAFKRPKQLQ